MREPLTGPERFSLKATCFRWERDRRPADARQLADAFGVLVAERDRLEDERDRARAVAANAEKTLGEQIDRAIAAEAERDTARTEAGQLRTRLAAVRAERDAAREQVKRVRALVASASWEHALVKARDVRRTLDGTETP